MSLHHLARFALVPLALLATGCASDTSGQILTPFLDQDFQTWNRSGTSSIQGQAFFKIPAGRVYTCAGEQVALMPRTAYNTELEKLLESGKGIPDNYERRARKYERTVMCDGDGRFSFEGLPNLPYIVLTRITWQESPLVPYITSGDKGGYLFQEVDVHDGSNKVALSERDFVSDTN